MRFLVVVAISIGALLANGANQTTCTVKPKQKNTSTILSSLRQEMRNAGIGMYVVFSDDEHGSENIQEYDRRRQWITGFHGSVGIAVVTLRTAALWTDSRYFIQAEEELDCTNWLLMRDRTAGVPNIAQWILSEANLVHLPLGGTPALIPSSWWSSINTALKEKGQQLRAVDDLIDRIWPSKERPNELQQPIVQHDVIHAGEIVAQKLRRTTAELRRYRVTVAIITALDEIAWQFNLRGADNLYNPFFKSYAIIYANYRLRQPELFVNLAQLDNTVYPADVKVLNYTMFWSQLNRITVDPTVSKIWVSPRVSQAVFGSIPTSKVKLPLMNSPVQRMKALKNPVERQGMRDSQVRDAVVRLKHLGWIEEQLNNGVLINESGSANRLLLYQRQQNRFQMPSFRAISASGQHAAIPRFSPEPITARPITKNQIYLLDAGSHYLDGTTDITRTHHFGTPSDLERRAYTRALQGVLSLAAAVFPEGTYGRSLDYLARMRLHRDGMIYEHFTGHGIGHFLGVDEGPQSIRFTYDRYEEPLTEGMFLSNEPGYYKAQEFGIRIENDMEVVVANYSIRNDKQFLRFDTITLVPYERSLIDLRLLTAAQYDAINQYHAKVVQILEPLLKDDPAALKALHSRTALLDPPSIPKKILAPGNGALETIGSFSFVTLMIIVMWLF